MCDPVICRGSLDLPFAFRNECAAVIVVAREAVIII